MLIASSADLPHGVGHRPMKRPYFDHECTVIRFLDSIGQGGMGQVYKAKHRVMKRIVALKTLPSAATKSEQAVRRFHREVKVAGRLFQRQSDGAVEWNGRIRL